MDPCLNNGSHVAGRDSVVLHVQCRLQAVRSVMKFSIDLL